MQELTISFEQAPAAGPSGEPKRRGNRTTRVPEILEAAIRVFGSEGSAGFTQRRIASEAGIRLNTLQHYFGTREELLRSTIEALVKRYLEQYRALIKDRSRSPDARLDAIVDELFDAISSPGSDLSAWGLHCWSLAEHEPFVHDLMVDTVGQLLEIAASLVAQINPALSSGDCKLRGALIVSHLQGLLVFTRRVGKDWADGEALCSATKSVWKALSRAS